MKQWMLLGLLGLGAAAQAHDVWVAAPAHQPAGKILHADLGYSHDFPNVEKIADDRVHIFKPLQLTGSSKKTVDLVNKGENYQYVSKVALPAGSYWVSATYQPTFWSKNQDGWKQQTLKQLAGATYCEQSQMFGKSFVQVGNGAVDEAVLTRPIGQELELVPLKIRTKSKPAVFCRSKSCTKASLWLKPPLPPARTLWRKWTWNQPMTTASLKASPAKPIKTAWSM